MKFHAVLVLLSGFLSVAWLDENPKGQFRAWLNAGIGRYESDVGACEPDIRRRYYREVGSGFEYYFAQKHSVGMGLNLSRVTGQPDDSDMAGDLPYDRPGKQLMAILPYQFYGRIFGIGVAPGMVWEQAIDGRAHLYGWGGLYLRLGQIRQMYLDASIFTPGTNVSAVTHGWTSIGIGSHLDEKVSFWFGLQVAPFSDYGVGLSLSYFPTNRFGVSSFVRRGDGDLGSEWGTTAGVTYKFNP